MKRYNLIFLNDAVLLSSKPYLGWKEIQRSYQNYKVSLDFETLKDVKDYLVFEYNLNIN